MIIFFKNNHFQPYDVENHLENEKSHSQKGQPILVLLMSYIPIIILWFIIKYSSQLSLFQNDFT